MARKAATQVDAWEKVSKSFGLLEANLRRYTDALSAEAAADRAEFEKSVKELLSAFEESIGAAAKLVRNPGLGKDLADMAASVREAFVATLQAAGQQVREGIASTTSARTRHTPAAKRAAVGGALPHKTPARKAPTRKATATEAKASPRNATKAAAAKSAPDKAAPTKAGPRKGSTQE